MESGYDQFSTTNSHNFRMQPLQQADEIGKDDDDPDGKSDSRKDEENQAHKFTIFVIFTAVLYDYMIDGAVSPMIPFLIEGEHRIPQNGTNTTSNETWAMDDDVEPWPGYSELSGETGHIWGMKHVFEMICSPLAGYLVHKFGHRIPLIAGGVLSCVAMSLFAMFDSYAPFLIFRALQGCGSSMTVVSSFSILADMFNSKTNRNKADAIAITGIAVGIFAGMECTLLYSTLGKVAYFLLIAALGLLSLAWRCCLKSPPQKYNLSTRRERFTEWRRVFTDMYVLIPTIINFIPHLYFGVEWATGITYAVANFRATQPQISLCLTVACLIQIAIQAGLIALVSTKVGESKYYVSGVGLVIAGIGLIIFSLCENVWELIGPLAFTRIGWSLVSTFVYPVMAQIMDVRHASQYGYIYSMVNVAARLGSIVGAFSSAPMVRVFGLKLYYLLVGFAGCILSFLSIILKEVPEREDDHKHDDDEHEHLSDQEHDHHHHHHPHGEHHGGKNNPEEERLQTQNDMAAHGQ